MNRIFKINDKESFFVPEVIFLKKKLKGAHNLKPKDLKKAVKSQLNDNENGHTYSINEDGDLQVSAYQVKYDEEADQSQFLIPINEYCKAFLAEEGEFGYVVIALKDFGVAMTFYNGLLLSYDSGLQSESDLIEVTSNLRKSIAIKGHGDTKTYTDVFIDSFDSEIIEIGKKSTLKEIDKNQKIRKSGAFRFSLPSIQLNGVSFVLVSLSFGGLFLLWNQVNNLISEGAARDANLSKIVLNQKEVISLIQRNGEQIENTNDELKRELRELQAKLNRRVSQSGSGNEGLGRTKPRLSRDGYKMPGISGQEAAIEQPSSVGRVSSDFPCKKLVSSLATMRCKYVSEGVSQVVVLNKDKEVFIDGKTVIYKPEKSLYLVKNDGGDFNQVTFAQAENAADKNIRTLSKIELSDEPKTESLKKDK